jgi:hypothetical protein
MSELRGRIYRVDSPAVVVPGLWVLDARNRRGLPFPAGSEAGHATTRTRLPRRSDDVRIWGLSKTQANYRPAPTREVRCARCKYMFPPLALGGCRLVRGPIRGTATCDQFTSRRGRSDALLP